MADLFDKLASNDPTAIPKATEPAKPRAPKKLKRTSKKRIKRGGTEVQGNLFEVEGPVPVTAATSSANLDKIVDDLIAEYLPALEQKLRARLRALLEASNNSD